jgi:hypothetical protein
LLLGLCSEEQGHVEGVCVEGGHGCKCKEEFVEFDKL